jgi:hypothetical protein
MMGDADDEDGSGNFDAFRDCLFAVIVDKYTAVGGTSSRRRKGSSNRVSAGGRKKDGNTMRLSQEAGEPDPSELADFSDYLAAEIFASFPAELRQLSYQEAASSSSSLQKGDSRLSDKWSLPLTQSAFEEVSGLVPGHVTDSLAAYGLIEPPLSDVQSFIAPVLSAYVAAVVVRPPKWSETRTTACEICERDWVPLTYHHLIPRQIHAKVLKRGWHDEHQLNSVAWLCRACHSFVHRMAPNEELARQWYTVDLICEREDVQKWAQWVGRVRWKKT